jgi:hypothetical protein
MVFTWVSVDVMDFFLLSVGVSERFRMRVLSLTRDRRDVSSRGVDEPGEKILNKDHTVESGIIM